MPNPKSIYQLKVTLRDSKPPIWRRILVTEETTLAQLHDIIQRVMGWENYHLHMFRIGGAIYGDPADDEFGSMGTKNETRFRLNQVGLREKSTFTYEYDFGDSWEHTLLLEKIIPAEPGTHYPLCVTGKRACPPEDVGGIWGYTEFLEAIADPNHKEHDEYLEWIGGDFDPETFDLDEINELLQTSKAKHGRKQAKQQVEVDMLEDSEDDDMFAPSPAEQEATQAALISWVQNLTPEHSEAFNTLPLRRDMLTFLDYLEKNRTVGTQSTGNLPLKAVKAITEKFVHPPALEETIGDHTYKVHSEDEVWPLLFVHTLAFFSRLLEVEQNRVWQVTPDGQRFPQLPSPIQVFLLLINWWGQVGWEIAFPVEGLANGLPANFKAQTLISLLELPVGESVSPDPFADDIIARSGMRWPSQDQRFVQGTMRTVVTRTVIYPMADFGVLECTYEKKPMGNGTVDDLQTICLTPIGKGMLELLK